MKMRIMRISNSQSFHIPRVLIDHSSIDEDVEREAKDAQIAIRPAERPRHGWDEAFRSMAEPDDDPLLDEDQWQW